LVVVESPVEEGTTEAADVVIAWSLTATLFENTVEPGMAVFC
jgi:hypothetical protein